LGCNFGNILDAIETAPPADAPAFIHGERMISWVKARQATNTLAHSLISRRRPAW
jgi:fatty-acyl-CoA synthase